MILFCLPYAGGSEVVYYNWKNYLDSSIKLYPVELKGRGKRFTEDFYEDIEEAVEDIFQMIKEEIVKGEYAIYGHSMGSLLAYELYYKINEMGFEKPKHIFFSGCKAPHVVRARNHIYSLANEDFVNEIMKFGGTPEEILMNKELMEVFIPILRNDFKIVETYKYKEKINKIECSVSVLNGKEDSIPSKDIFAWNEHSSEKCKIYNFEGNHFFINNNVENITRIIKSALFEKELAPLIPIE